MLHGRYQLAAALGIIEQIILQVGVAVDHPNVAQYLVQHSRRTARSPLTAQLIQNGPSGLPEQSNDDFPIGQRCVVVRDFSQPRFRLFFIGMSR
jgi:hypothetical protein